MSRYVLALLALALGTEPLLAIPPFARRYNLTCASCHDPVPRLTAFGESFAARGFALLDDDTTGMTTLGDPLLALNTALPVAIRFDAYTRYVSGSGGVTDFRAPFTVKLMSGGEVARNISYYIYLMMSENGTMGALEDAWLTFREPLGMPADVTFGQFQIIDPLWKRETRVTLEDYAVLRTRVGGAAARLTYDRGIIVGAGLTASTDVFLEVVNGNGIDAAAADGSFDSDASKAGVAILTQQVGPLQVGLLGYWGRQRFAPTAGPGQWNRTRMAGPSLKFEGASVAAGGQYLYRDDSDAAFDGPGARTRTRGGFAELTWWPQGRGSRLLLTGLYNNVTSDDAAADMETGTFNVSWLAARNVRLAGELTLDLLADRGSVALGVVTAF